MPLELDYLPALPRRGFAYIVRHTTLPDVRGQRTTTLLGVVAELEHAAALVFDRWGEYLGSDAGWECMSYAAVRERYGLDLRTELHAWDTIYVRALSVGGCVTVEVCNILPAAKAYPTTHDLIAERLSVARVLHDYYSPRYPITIYRFAHSEGSRPARMARVVYTDVGHFVGYENEQGRPVWTWAVERDPLNHRYTRSIPSFKTMEAALAALLTAREAIAKHSQAGTLMRWHGDPNEPTV